jgi:hypothetical protein
MPKIKYNLAEEVISSIFAEEMLIADADLKEKQSSGDMKLYYHGFRSGVQACQMELMLKLKLVHANKALEKIIDDKELHLKFLAIENRLAKLAASNEYVRIDVENKL